MSWGKGGGDEVRGGIGGLTGYCWSFGSRRKVLSRGMTCPDLGFKRDSPAGARIEVGHPVYERRPMESWNQTRSSAKDCFVNDLI